MVGSASLIIRPAAQSDDDAIWRVIEPVFRAGETHALPREISRADALAAPAGPRSIRRGTCGTDRRHLLPARQYARW
jgi:hypothetical protein